MLEFQKRKMIKEAFDNLPSGICFFDETGRLVLCNRQMYRLVFLLAKRDLQSVSEMRRMLEHPMAAELSAGKYILDNGESWQFSSYPVQDDLGNRYIQYIASDVTEINRNQEKLNESNENLRLVNEQLRELLTQVDDIVREEETLAVKIRIHDELGHNMLAARKLLFENADAEQIKEAVGSWKQTVDTLNHINHMELVELSEEDLYTYANQIGVTLSLEGRLPDDEATRNLFVGAIQECINNCVRHTDSTQITATVTRQTLTVTNTGEKVTHDSNHKSERGGLLTLREKAEKLGFTMTTEFTGGFKLELTKE